MTAIGTDPELRYSFGGSSLDCGNIEFPTEIKGLVYLQTLEISGRVPQDIPSDIVHLPRLCHLRLPNVIGLPEGIGNMKSLRALHCENTGKSSPEDIKGIGELTNLRDLELFWRAYECDMVAAGVVDALASSIGKLRDLKSLILFCGPPKNYDDQLYSLSNPPLHIEVLCLEKWPFKGVPKWIGDLHCLRVIVLCVEHFSTKEVHVLGKLPSLVGLNLKVSHIPEDSAAIICTGLFPVLEHLRLDSKDDVTACMRFEEGAMSKLRVLDLKLRKRWGGATPVGMEHLSALHQIYLSAYHMGSEQLRRDAMTVFWNAARVHPTRPDVLLLDEAI